MLDEKVKNAALSDIKKHMWGSQVFLEAENQKDIWEVLQMIKAISQKYQHKKVVVPTEVMLK